MTRRFTGWHMTGLLVTFFAVVIGVNFTMARFASSTFGGTVVENSYVASQEYNGWLEQARRQQALGWTQTIAGDRRRHVIVSVTTPQGPLAGATVSATATHPLGAEPARTLSFLPGPSGYRSESALPAGRWLLHVAITRGSDRASFDDEIGS